jgi:hypothetical protein
LGVDFIYLFRKLDQKPPYMLQWVMSVSQTGLGYAAWPAPLPQRRPNAGDRDAETSRPPGLFDRRRPPALPLRAYHRTHQTHAATTANQMMKAGIMMPPARHTSRETRRAWMP